MPEESRDRSVDPSPGPSLRLGLGLRMRRGKNSAQRVRYSIKPLSRWERGSGVREFFSQEWEHILSCEMSSRGDVVAVAIPVPNTVRDLDCLASLVMTIFKMSSVFLLLVIVIFNI